MKPNRYLIGLNSAAILGLTAGCATLAEADGAKGTKPAAVPAETAGVKSKIEPAVEAQGRALLDAFVRNDAAAFVAVLPENLRGQFGMKEFALARAELGKTLGQPISYQFDTILVHPLLRIGLWKVSFERQNAAGETLCQEALFRVIAGTVDGEPRIVAFNFL